MNLLAVYLRDEKLTQEEFAERCGLDQAQISEYVNGKRRPGLDHAFAIEEATGGRVTARYWRGIGPIGRNRGARTRKAI